MGSSQAMHDLGFCYQYGQGVTKDEYQAAQLYRQAAKSGFALEDQQHWIWDSQYDKVEDTIMQQN
jgi:TPR repeat protein